MNSQLFRGNSSLSSVGKTRDCPSLQAASDLAD